MTEFETKLDNFRDGIRKNLREVFPEVDRLESLTELEDLKLKACQDKGGLLILNYEAVSKNYPSIRKLLMKSGVAKKHNIRYGNRIHPEDLIGHQANDIQGEFYRAHCEYKTQLLYYGSSLQIFLEVRPKLKKEGVI